MSSLVYDTGALLAGDKNAQVVWAHHDRAIHRGIRPTVPAGCLAQAWRDGARQASLARLLKGCRVVALDESTAKRAGLLLGGTGTTDVVDAHAAILAADHAAVLLTSDPGDLGTLLAGLDRGNDVEVVTV